MYVMKLKTDQPINLKNFFGVWVVKKNTLYYICVSTGKICTNQGCTQLNYFRFIYYNY